MPPPRRESHAIPIADDLPLSIGDIVDGKYRVESLIGRGGMGVVFAATHIALGHRVALKVVLGGGPMQAEFVARFEQEARAVALLTSPHVARVHDVGHLGPSTPYMVMELLTGETLNKKIRRGALHFREVARFTREICDALGEAHALGIIHRDLKGDNVFLAQRPNGQISAKLLDFGISKVTNSAVAGDGEPLTKTRTFLGTPASMAPEQFTGGGEVTPKTDVWSLGVMIFKMLTGTSAFHAPSMFETAEKVVRGPTPSLSEHRPELHPAWSALIEGALRKDPAERLSLEELLRAVKQAERLEAAANPESPDPGGETASLVVAPVPAVSDGATHTAVITSTGGSYSARFGSSSSPSSPWAVRPGERRPPTVPPAAPRARRMMTRRKAAIGGAVAALVGIGAFAATYFDPFEVRAHDAPPAHAAPAPPVVAESAEVVEAVPVPVVPLTARPVATPGSSAGAVAEASSVVAPVRAEHARAPSLATSRPRPPTPTAPTAEVVSPARPAPVAEPRPAKPKPLTNER